MIQNLYLGAGAMKAGTTWLYAQLIDHPDLYFSPEKEIHFIDYYFNKTSVLSQEGRLKRTKEAFVRNADRAYPGYNHNLKWYSLYLEKNVDFLWYKNLFSLNSTNKLNCDFSNLTCQINEKNWNTISSLVENLKVTYVLRDPLNRLWSHLKFHHQYAGLKMDFEKWSVLEFKDYIEKPFIKVNSEYGRWHNIMQKSLSKNSYKVFYFEDFINDSVETLITLEKFLEIRHHDFKLEKINNKVNASVSKPMPLNFREASKHILAAEYDMIQSTGLEVHKLWSGL